MSQVEASPEIALRPATAADRPWVQSALSAQWGSARVVSRGVAHQADELPGLVAEVGGRPVGLLTYNVVDGDLEVVTLQTTLPGRGIGTALLAAARDLGHSLGCRRVWLVTTNDNEPAQRFYERQGMRRVAVHAGAVAESRKLKPEIPRFGVNGLPIDDEIEYAYEI